MSSTAIQPDSTHLLNKGYLENVSREGTAPHFLKKVSSRHFERSLRSEKSLFSWGFAPEPAGVFLTGISKISSNHKDQYIP
jgi:hypothetical protein